MSTDTTNLFDFAPELEEAFEKAEVKARGEFTDIPDGEYVVRLDKVTIKEMPSKDRQLSGQLRVAKGDHAGRVIFKNWTLNAKGMPFFKTDMALMGVKLKTLKDLPAALEQLNPQDPAARLILGVNKVAQKSNPQYSNVYINEVLASVEGEEEGSEVEAGVKF